jgi:hypothetical protein
MEHRSSDALREYLARHAPDKITEAMNRAIAEIGEVNACWICCADGLRSWIPTAGGCSPV